MPVLFLAPCLHTYTHTHTHTQTLSLYLCCEVVCPPQQHLHSPSITTREWTVWSQTDSEVKSRETGRVPCLCVERWFGVHEFIFLLVAQHSWTDGVHGSHGLSAYFPWPCQARQCMAFPTQGHRTKGEGLGKRECRAMSPLPKDNAVQHGVDGLHLHAHIGGVGTSRVAPPVPAEPPPVATPTATKTTKKRSTRHNCS